MKIVHVQNEYMSEHTVYQNIYFFLIHICLNLKIHVDEQQNLLGFLFKFQTLLSDSLAFSLFSIIHSMILSSFHSMP